jgi:CRISPR type IV-associated protein Csf3
VDNLQITAHLTTSLGAYDNWSPALEGILVYRLLEENNLLSPNPTPDQVAETKEFIDLNLPLKQGEIKSDKYWCVSSPCYVLHGESTDKYRKRWDNHENNLDWGKRKPKFLTSEGAEKSYDLPLYTRLVSSISWFAVGDKTRIKEFLQSVTHIQKKRGYGNGEVREWEIGVIYDDYHLWRDGKLMRPIPVRLLDQKIDNPQMIWGWKPPVWLASNKELCYMPKDNVIYG